MLHGLTDLRLSSPARQQMEVAPHRDEPRPIADNDSVDVFLVGGHDLAFEGLKALLTKHGFNIVGMERQLCHVELPAAYQTRSFLIIIEVTADDDPQVLDELLPLRKTYPHARIVVLLDGLHKVGGFLPDNVGANAIMDRNVACQALVKSLEVVMAGYGVLSPIARMELDVGAPSTGNAMVRLSVGQDRCASVSASLSDRELEIIGCIAEGQSNKLIARRFSISESTVKIHVRGILRKINARNRTQAAVWALHRGFGASAVALD